MYSLYISRSITLRRPGRSHCCHLAENGDLRWPARSKVIAAFVAGTLRGVLLARFGSSTPDAHTARDFRVARDFGIIGTEQPLKYRQLVVESLSANATEQNHSISSGDHSDSLVDLGADTTARLLLLRTGCSREGRPIAREHRCWDVSVSGRVASYLLTEQDVRLDWTVR